MVQKTVSDLIFDKFAEKIKGDDVFRGISDDLITIVRQTHRDKTEIEKVLRKKQDEDSKSGN